MATRELFYGQSGSFSYDDTWVPNHVIGEEDWYPAPYDTYPLRGALFSQAYCTDAPVYDIELIRRMDVDGTSNTLLKADATSKLPVDSAIVENGTNVIVTSRNIILAATGTGSIGSADVLWTAVYANAFKMPTGAGTGKIIQSDADGNFSWVTFDTGANMAILLSEIGMGRRMVEIHENIWDHQTFLTAMATRFEDARRFMHTHEGTFHRGDDILRTQVFS